MTDTRQYYQKNRERYKALAKANYYANYAAYRAKRSSPKGKYERQRRRAVERGIAWAFTFETWVGWWGLDYSKRSVRSGGLIMARYGDKGPYSPFNCYKSTPAENVKHNWRGGL